MYRVLIADDEIIELDYIDYVLRKYDNLFKSIEKKNNGKDAIIFAKENPIDLAILDIRMPFYNGIETGIILKKYHPNIKIILNSAYSDFKYSEKAIKYKFDYYLLKPTSEDKLISSIKFVLKNTELDNSEDNIKNRKLNFINLVNKYIDCIVSINEEEMFDTIKSISELLFESDLVNRERFAGYLFLSVENIINRMNNYDKNLIKFDRFSSSLKENNQSVDEIYNLLEQMTKLIINIRLENFSQTDIALASIVNYVNQNFTNKNITLSSLSEIFYTNQSYLSREFKNFTGQTFTNYLCNLRLKRANDLLINTQLKVNEIIELSGFSSKQSFYKQFKKKYNLSPLERREKING